MPVKLPESAFRPLGRTGRSVSAVGFGSYRVDDRVPQHRQALKLAIESGVNLVDTSTNYGDGHSELLVGQVLRELPPAERREIVVVTKAGYVQGSNLAEAMRRRKEGRPWSEMTEVSRDCWHCVSPDFLKDQLTSSLDRLRLPRVDLLLLHNPEYFLQDAQHRGIPLQEARDVFYDRIRRAFLRLEEERQAGRIGGYGVSSNTFVVPASRPDAVDLSRLLELAGEGFTVIQLPLNPLERGALDPHHTADHRSVLQVARQAGLGVLVNRPLNAFGPGGLVRFAEVGLPFEPLPPAPGDPWTELAEAEADFRKRWAPRLSFEDAEQSPAEMIAVSDLFRQAAARVPDMVSFANAWESYVAPRLDDLLPQLEEVFEKSPGFRQWAETYRERVYRAAATAAEKPRANEARRVGTLLAQLAEAFGAELPGETVAQKTINALLEVEGVDVVLVGMRSPRYVADVVAAFTEVQATV